MNHRTFLILGCLSLCACASITDGTLESTEVVTFVSVPSGAAIKAPGRTICYTPCRQPVERYLLTQLYAELEGFETVDITPKAELNAMVLGNIVAGGVVGAGFDVLTGRATRVGDVITIEFPNNAPQTISREE